MEFKNVIGRYFASEPFLFQFIDSADQVKATAALMNFFENIHLQSELTTVEQDQLDNYVLTNLYGFYFKDTADFIRLFTPEMKRMAIGSFAILEGQKGNSNIVIPAYEALGWTVTFDLHALENVIDVTLDPFVVDPVFTRQAAIVNPWLEYYYTLAGVRISVNGFFNQFDDCVDHMAVIDFTPYFLTTIMFPKCINHIHNDSFEVHFETQVEFDDSQCHIANIYFDVDWAT
jgi:hypothetical protein